MISIVYARRFIVFKKRWFQTILIAISICLSLLIHILIPLEYNLIEINQPNSTQTTSICIISTDILNIEMWIITANYILANIIINNFLNIKTILFIMASRKRVTGNANNRNSSLSIRDRKFAICSVCLNLASMILKLPFCICVVVVSYSNKSFDEVYSIIKIAGSINNIDNCFSFFINMFVNSLFYNEFFRLFGFRKSQSNAIHNTTSNGVLKPAS